MSAKTEQQQTVIALMGPTASGKTALAIALSKQFAAEIISVDSALVYRDMDIGTAKPSAEERALVPHHLIDIRDAAQPYCAKEFCDQATTLIEEILARGKTPILAGGTMLYFKALIEGIDDMPAANPSIRADIEGLAQVNGWPYIHALLKEVDPQSAERLHPNHSQRLTRALEVYRLSGKTLTEWHQQQTSGLSSQYHWLKMAVAPRQRNILHQRIAKRFNDMLASGFEDEVLQLMARGDLNVHLPAIRAVGYRQMWQHLSGQISRQEMHDKALAATRQLAKRQLTWLRGWPDVNWIYTQDEKMLSLSSDEILQQALNIAPLTTI